DLSLYVMTSEYGAASQLEKIDMLDFADMIVLNKFEKRGAEDALRDVRKQVMRNRKLFGTAPEQLPVFPTIASQFNDAGVNTLFAAICSRLDEKWGRIQAWKPAGLEPLGSPKRQAIIPGERVRYLAEIAENGRRVHKGARASAEAASRAHGLHRALAELGDAKLPQPLDRYAEADLAGGDASLVALRRRYNDALDAIGAEGLALLKAWPQRAAGASADEYSYQVRGREVRGANYTETLSHQKLPKIALPTHRDWGDLLYFLMTENLPGGFPYTAGIYPYRREDEDPTRMFAGEGTPERTNRRFHYVARGGKGARLSTAFDSTTLYGEDPDERPDIYGRIGNSGVSIATLDDMKRLYSGFDLCAPSTSVSMTINGPAPMILAMFMNTAIDQRVERYLKDSGRWEEAQAKIDAIWAGRERPRYRGELPPGNDGFGLGLLGVTGDQLVEPEVYERLKAEALSAVRGTVQADILKEDQAQNTCIFSTEFALRMMGDVQQYFTDHDVRNFYSVSISGYHIAEAGANPVSQLAFTLANGFTIVEYYLARGMKIDDFAPNLSFFFSNGMDPEYAVIGRVARRIWARAMREIYGGSARSQMLKYHIQTSGRSLHAQEIQFNDIRTTLQALYALFDSCNSLHTNAYDEALTTPTEESVRRAVAIQLIIARELGLNKNQNPWQGSFILEHLTDMVEEAVYKEFESISERGGVLGAMETMYQRGKIQEESLYYEHKKHDGSLPIIGVNTFLPEKRNEDELKQAELIRSTEDEKQSQVEAVRAFNAARAELQPSVLAQLQQVAATGGNVFEQLVEAVKVASLGRISRALYSVGRARVRSRLIRRCPIRAQRIAPRPRWRGGPTAERKAARGFASAAARRGVPPAGSRLRRRHHCRILRARHQPHGGYESGARSGSPRRSRMRWRASNFMRATASGSFGSGATTGSSTSTSSRPGRGRKSPPRRTRRAPRMTTGTTGMPARAAVTKAPLWKRARPGSSVKVPSGKKATEPPLKAVFRIRRASLALSERLWRSTNSWPRRRSMNPATGTPTISFLITKPKREGSTAYSSGPST
nr:methylmalonyl-CoA mutase family protein [Steroidobacteraceae bacterium]